MNGMKRCVRQLASLFLCLALLLSLSIPACGYEAEPGTPETPPLEEPSEPPAEEDGALPEEGDPPPQGENPEDPETPVNPEDTETSEEPEAPENPETPEEPTEPKSPENPEELPEELWEDAALLDTGAFLADPTADPLPDGAIPISDAAGLMAIGFSGDYYLTADLTLSGPWTPIPGFNGTLDGRGHRIQLLQISSGSGDAGLFASASGTIRNLGITLSRNGVTGSGNTGALVGQGRSGLRVINCFVAPNAATAAPVVRGGTAGGLVGYVLSGGLLENCYSTVNVEGSGCTGGLAGCFGGSMTNCHASGAVSSSGSDSSVYLGGLAGRFGGTMTSCHAEGNVSWARTGAQTNDGSVYGGGLIGNDTGDETVLDRCSATGLVDLQGIAKYYYAGGLAGLTYGEITRCSATGDVTAGVTLTIQDSSVDAGGLVGFGWSSRLSDCFARGNVTASEAATCNVGGLLGRNSGSGIFLNCYAAGNLSAYRGTIGTLSGTVGTSISVNSCYFLDTQTRTFTTYGTDASIPKNLLDQGAALTAEQFRLQESFPGWNFYKNWKLDPNANDGWPALRTPEEELEDPADRPDEPEEPRWVDGFLADPFSDSIDGFQPVTSAAELAALSSSDGSYYLAGDIVLEEKWEPIQGFSGVLDGRGHCISNLYVNASSSLTYAGLFDSLRGAEIRNLAVSVAEVRGTAQTLGSSLFAVSAGGIAGYADETAFVNCYVTGGPVSARSSKIYAGGLLGEAGPGVSLTACYAENPVTVDQTDLNAQELDCGAGGLVGWGGYTTLSRCFAAGDVSVRILNELGSNTVRAGGLVGGQYMGTAEDCYALGDVTVDSVSDGGPGYLWIGGFSAYTPQQAARCYAGGDVRITQNAGASGSTSQAGALFGSRFSETVSACYYSSARTVEAPEGGGITYAGTQLTEAQMKTQSAYGGWTFGEGGWKLEAELNGGLPCFSGYRPATGSRAGYAGFLLDPAADPLPEGAIPVSSAEELKNLRSMGQGVSDPYFYLTRDLYLEEEWAGNFFAIGTLDGRGHHITNLHTDKKSYGLFYSVSGTVKNLAIHVGKEGFTGETGSSAVGPWTGALTPNASNGAQIINCFVTGGKISGNRVGGLVGNANATNTSGSSAAISYCYTTVNVEGTDAGGLVGRNGETTTPRADLLIDHCYSTGIIRGTYAGGLVGYVANRGENSAIRDSYSTARVSAPRNTSGAVTGGLIGQSSAYIMLRNCYAAGTVGGSGNTAGNLVGGGASNVTVLNCFSPETQKVTGGSVSTQGKVLSQAEAGQKASYTGWDFTADWQLVPEWNGGYPTLRGYVPVSYASVANGNPNAQSQGFLLDPLEDSIPAGAIPIGTEAELKALEDREAGADGYFYLTRDIRLTGPWTPIRHFTGTLDGRGWTIRNLYTDSTSAGGLFVSLGNYIAANYKESNADIRNLGIEIAPQGVNGVLCAGGLAAYANNFMDSGSLRSGNVTITNCFVTGGPVSLRGNIYTNVTYLPVGGILGGGEASISYCYTAADVTGTATELKNSEALLAGGIYGGASGINYASHINHCFALGNVTAKAEKAGTNASVNAGGIAGGYMGTDTGSISNSYAMGTVSASGAADSSRNRVGGISGYGGSVTGCWTPQGQTLAGNASSGSSGYSLTSGTLGSLSSSQWALDSTGAVNNGYPYFPDTEPMTPAIVRGSVTCAFPGEPMTVELRRYSGDSYEAVSTLTLQDAAYSSASEKTFPLFFTVLQPGTYAVYASKPRHSSCLSERKVLALGETLELGNIRLERMGWSVTVNLSPYDSTSTAKGQLLKDGSVIAEADSEAYSGSTDRILFQDIPNGEYTMRITRPGYQPHSSPVTVSGRDLTHTIQMLEAPEQLPGFLTRPDGFLQDPAAGPVPQGASAISTEDQLRSLSGSGSYYLTRDIRLSGEWTPISSFSGTLDGRGHKITNLSVPYSAARQDAGLFSVLSGSASVRNLAVETASTGVFASARVSSYIGNTAGILAAAVQDSASVTNCYTTGMVSTSTSSGITPPGTGQLGTTDYCGGLVGIFTSEGRITDCYSTASVHANGYALAYAGGLVGDLNSGAVHRCFSTGPVAAQAGYQAVSGGLAGVNNRVIEDSYAHGAVSASRNPSGSRAASPILWAGGLAGVNNATGGIGSCYAAGNVSASCTDAIQTLLTSAGGLIGMNSGQVSDAYALGNVVSSGCGGGLIGSSHRGAYAARCYALGNIRMIVSGSYTVIDAGRLTGDGRESGESFNNDLGLTFINCYTGSFQQITYSQNSYISGIADAGTVMSARSLRDLSQLTGFSESVWTVDGAVNRGYPYLKSMEGLGDQLDGLYIQCTPTGDTVTNIFVTLRTPASGDRSKIDVELRAQGNVSTDVLFMAVSYRNGRMESLAQQAGALLNTGTVTLRDVPRTLLYPTAGSGETFRLLLVDAKTYVPYMKAVSTAP